MTPKLHPLEPRTRAPGGRVIPASPLPVPATPASGWGRQGLSPPLRCPPRMEAGQVPRALPKALKSKIIAIEASGAETQLSNTPCPNSAGAPADPLRPVCSGGGRG